MVDSRDESLEEVSQPSSGDIVRASIDTGLQLVPGAGLVLPWLELLVARPLEKRRDEWLQSLADRLLQLEEQVRNGLSENEAFITALYHGVRAAISTSSREKHEALRNAALNSALSTQPETDLFETFLRFVAELTPIHINLLRIAVDLNAAAAGREVSKEALRALNNDILEPFLKDVLPDARQHPDVYRGAWRELYSRGLVRLEDLSLRISVTHMGERSSYATDTGRQFVQFISDPSATAE